MNLKLIKSNSIITMDKTIHGNCILIEKDRIKNIGDNLDFPENVQIFDFGDKTILPGFRDIHVHFFQTGLKYIDFNAEKCNSEDELLQAMSDWLINHEEIIGFGYSPPLQRSMPTLKQLDRISNTKPIYIRRVDGHSSAINTVVLNSLTDIVSDIDGFNPTKGWLFSEAHTLVNSFFLEKTSHTKLIRAAKIVSSNALNAGCTSIAAMIPHVEWMKLLLESNLDIKTVEWLETLEPFEAKELGLSRVGGCLPMVDGSLGSRSALLSLDYSDQPGNRGTLEIAKHILYQWYFQASKLGLRTAVHAIGDAAVDIILSCLKELPDDNPAIQPRIEHAELLRDQQVAEIRDMKISLAMQPVFEEIWGGPNGMYFERLGSRWKSTNRYRDLLDNGITIGGSSDSYITPIDPLRGIQAAINHPNPDQRISLREAIGLFTINAARAEFVDEETGSLTPGKLADIVVLDRQINESNINSANIYTTIVEGKIKFRKTDDYYEK